MKEQKPEKTPVMTQNTTIIVHHQLVRLMAVDQCIGDCEKTGPKQENN